MAASNLSLQEQSMCDHRAGCVGLGSVMESPGGHSERALRVLLVDDNVDVIESLAILLRMYGYSVLTCTHPLDALEAAPDFSPDVCILDIGLPCMSGHELAQRLRMEGLSRSVFIAVTGYGADEFRAASGAAGFALHLTKPVDPEFLLGRLTGVHRAARVASIANAAAGKENS
ncbi:response regulator [Ramlibacter sp. Leaf400]|uniref:response regulator n=1 Tax=Ramlibacter sp. Leaf400 TaxID=1736365 RepID=UPI001F1B0B78|nr:response regulator [Ramlibacter sp. Leaf400]